jgi:hypothetical protein
MVLLAGAARAGAGHGHIDLHAATPQPDVDPDAYGYACTDWAYRMADRHADLYTLAGQSDAHGYPYADLDAHGYPYADLDADLDIYTYTGAAAAGHIAGDRGE